MMEVGGHTMICRHIASQVNCGVHQLPIKVDKAFTDNVVIMWTWGDASIASAKKEGNITQIGTIDYDTLAILSFIYSQTCTVVSGK